MFTPELMKKTGSQRGLGLRGSEAPDQNKQDSRAPEKLIKGCKLAMLFYFNPKANLRKYSNFYFLKRCFYKFFSTPDSCFTVIWSLSSKIVLSIVINGYV